MVVIFWQTPAGTGAGRETPWLTGGRGQGRVPVTGGVEPAARDVGAGRRQLPNIMSHCSAVLGRNTKFMRRVSPIEAEGSME